MRLFVAIQLSDEMKDALIEAQNSYYDHGVRGNYTSEENLHLTLVFIGEYPAAEPVLEALSEVSFKPFEITLEGTGCFDELRWAGIRECVPLEIMAKKVRRTLAEHGIPFDQKRFSPHITLIRKSSGKLPATRIRPVSMTVDAVSLLRSDRGKRGMIYTELGTIAAQE